MKLQQNRRKKRTPSPISCAGLRIFFRKMGKKTGRIWRRDTAFLRIASCVNHIGKTLARIRIKPLDFWRAMAFLMLDFATGVATSVATSVVVLSKNFWHEQKSMRAFLCAVFVAATSPASTILLRTSKTEGQQLYTHPNKKCSP